MVENCRLELALGLVVEVFNNPREEDKVLPVVAQAIAFKRQDGWIEAQQQVELMLKLFLAPTTDPQVSPSIFSRPTEAPYILFGHRNSLAIYNYVLWCVGRIRQIVETLPCWRVQIVALATAPVVTTQSAVEPAQSAAVCSDENFRTTIVRGNQLEAALASDTVLNDAVVKNFRTPMIQGDQHEAVSANVAVLENFRTPIVRGNQHEAVLANDVVLENFRTIVRDEQQDAVLVTPQGSGNIFNDMRSKNGGSPKNPSHDKSNDVIVTTRGVTHRRNEMRNQQYGTISSSNAIRTRNENSINKLNMCERTLQEDLSTDQFDFTNVNTNTKIKNDTGYSIAEIKNKFTKRITESVKKSDFIEHYRCCINKSIGDTQHATLNNVTETNIHTPMTHPNKNVSIENVETINNKGNRPNASGVESPQLQNVNPKLTDNEIPNFSYKSNANKFPFVDIIPNSSDNKFSGPHKKKTNTASSNNYDENESVMKQKHNVLIRNDNNTYALKSEIPTRKIIAMADESLMRHKSENNTRTATSSNSKPYNYRSVRNGEKNNNFIHKTNLLQPCSEKLKNSSEPHNIGSLTMTDEIEPHKFGDLTMTEANIAGRLMNKVPNSRDFSSVDMENFPDIICDTDEVVLNNVEVLNNHRKIITDEISDIYKSAESLMSEINCLEESRAKRNTLTVALESLNSNVNKRLRNLKELDKIENQFHHAHIRRDNKTDLPYEGSASVFDFEKELEDQVTSAGCKALIMTGRGTHALSKDKVEGNRCMNGSDGNLGNDLQGSSIAPSLNEKNSVLEIACKKSERPTNAERRHVNFLKNRKARKKRDRSQAVKTPSALVQNIAVRELSSKLLASNAMILDGSVGNTKTLVDSSIGEVEDYHSVVKIDASEKNSKTMAESVESNLKLSPTVKGTGSTVNTEKMMEYCYPMRTKTYSNSSLHSMSTPPLPDGLSMDSRTVLEHVLDWRTSVSESSVQSSILGKSKHELPMFERYKPITSQELTQDVRNPAAASIPEIFIAATHNLDNETLTTHKSIESQLKHQRRYYAESIATCHDEFDEDDLGLSNLFSETTSKPAHKMSRQQKRYYARRRLQQVANNFNKNVHNKMQIALGPALLPVKIGRHNVFHATLTAHGDAGSGVSVVSADVLKIAQIPINLKNNPNIILKVANDSELQTIGTASFNVQVGPKTTRVTAFVVRNLPPKLIFGTPWLKASKAVMDFDNMEIYFNDNKNGFVPISVRDPTVELKSQFTVIPMILSENKEFPPFSETACFVLPSKKHRVDALGFQGLIQSDNSCAGLYGLVTGTMPHTVSTEHFPIVVANMTDTPVKLPKGTKIAQLVPFHKEEDLLCIPVQLLDPKIPLPYQNARLPRPDINSLPPEWKDGWPPEFPWRDLAQDPRITTERLEKIKTLLQVKAAAFAINPDRPGIAHGIQMNIDTGDAKPIHTYPFRSSHHEKEVQSKMTTQMLLDSIIEPSSSPWSSPVLLIPKKGGKLRFCIDYRKLNNVTVKDVYPLPRIDECLTAFNGCEWFSVVDCAAGYWGVELDEESKAKTAFSTHDGHFQFKQMPFGLCNAPAVFMRLMHGIMAGIMWKYCLPYMDDIMIYSKTFEDHLEHVGEVLDRLIAAGLTLKGSKCNMFRQEVTYLGNIVADTGIKCDPAKLKAIEEMKLPTNLKELRSFLGLTGYYRRFIQKYSYMAKPLYEMTQGQPSPREIQAQFHTFAKDGSKPRLEAFHKLKTALLSAPILASPDFEKSFYLQTDACDYGISAVLSQKGPNNEEKIIACASRKLNGAEQNYHTTEKEALAMVYGCEQFRHYLLGRPFYAETDHSALTQLNKTTNTGRIRRWALKLSEFQPLIIYKPGVQNGNADGTSRLPVDPCCPSENGTEYNPKGYDFDEKYNKIVHVNAISVKHHPNYELEIGFEGPIGTTRMLEAQKNDPILKILREYIINGNSPEVEAITEKSKHSPNLLSMTGFHKLINNKKHRIYIDPTTNLLMCHSSLKRTTRLLGVERIMVPQSMIRQVLHVYHQSPKGGHLGRDKTLERLKCIYFWNNMNKDIREYIQSCVSCIKRKTPEPKLQGLVENYLDAKTSIRPFAMTQADVVGPLPLTANGNCYALVATCHVTKWKVVVPITDNSAATVADTLLTRVFYQFGHPDTLLTDQGSEFTSEVTRRLCTRLGIDQRFSTAYHHNTVAQSERFTRFLKDILAIYVEQNHALWDQFVPNIVYCYNTTVNETTGDTPYYLMYGVDAREGTQITSLPYHDLLFDEHYYRLTQLKQLRAARKLTNQRIKEMQQLAQERVNMLRRDITFKEGDLVFLWTPPAYKAGDATKFKLRYKGPYKVIKRISPMKYEVEHTLKFMKQPMLDENLKPQLDDKGVPIMINQPRKGVVSIERMRLYNPVVKWADFINPDFTPTPFHPPSITSVTEYPSAVIPDHDNENIPIPSSPIMSDISEKYTEVNPNGFKRGIDAVEIEKPVAALRDTHPSFPNKRRSPRNLDFADKVEKNFYIEIPKRPIQFLNERYVKINNIDPLEIKSYDQKHEPTISVNTSIISRRSIHKIDVQSEPYRSFTIHFLSTLCILYAWVRPSLFKEWIALDEVFTHLDLNDNTIPHYFDRLMIILEDYDLIIQKHVHSMKHIALHPRIQKHIRTSTRNHLSEIDFENLIEILLNTTL